MALPRLVGTSTAFHSLVGAHSFVLGQFAWHHRPASLRSTASQLRGFSSTPSRHDEPTSSREKSPADASSASSGFTSDSATDSPNFSLPPGWEDDPSFENVQNFSDLPHRFFGYNQHIRVNEDFKESLRQSLWQFRAPIRYAFAYGSGVFGQSGTGKVAGEDMSPHPHPPKAVEEWQKGGAKVIDFIFGVSHTQHWHSLNLSQNPHHYSGLKYLPYSSAAISGIQDSWGAGVYFNPFITVNGTMIKYGVVNLDTLASDLSEWRTLYLAGRLQKPVKILRDDPRIRMANQVNLLAALRTALLMLPEKFTERELYERIAALSYMGDPRMAQLPLGLGASENMSKVSNIVGAQLPGFRQLYVPLIENLPNVSFTDARTPRDPAWEKEDAIRHIGANFELAKDVLGGRDGLTLSQDLDPVKRGNMVRRLPLAFRHKLYFQYQKKFGIPGSAFDAVLERSADEDLDSGAFRRREGGTFEQRVAAQGDLGDTVGRCVSETVRWPATSQTVKGVFTSGLGKSWKYFAEKRKKGKAKKKGGGEGEGKAEKAEQAKKEE